MKQLTRSEAGAAQWPQVIGEGGRLVDAVTQNDPVTGTPMCKDCWDGRHDRTGCKIYACKCQCYKGRNRSTNGLNTPRKGHDTDLPFTGSFQV